MRVQWSFLLLAVLLLAVPLFAEEEETPKTKPVRKQNGGRRNGRAKQREIDETDLLQKEIEPSPEEDAAIRELIKERNPNRDPSTPGKKKKQSKTNRSEGSNCKFNSQCASLCCLNNRCSPKASKGSFCSSGELKGGRHADFCPCEAGHEFCEMKRKRGSRQLMCTA